MRIPGAAILLLCTVACGAPESPSTRWAVPLPLPEPHGDDEAVVAEGLAAQDPVDVAWGAYHAGELGVTASADALLGLLHDRPVLRDVAIDAIARLGLAVPADELVALHDAALARNDTQLAMNAMAVGLLDPERHRALLTSGFDAALAAIDENDWGIDSRLASFRGYANALASLRDPQLVATLVGMLETDIAIDVVSPGIRMGGAHCSCGSAFSSHCMGVTTSRSPFPPRAVWSIEAAGESQCVVTLPGPHDACLARVEIGVLYDYDESDLDLAEIADAADDAGDDADSDYVPLDANELAIVAELDAAVEAERRTPCEGEPIDLDDEVTVESSARNDEMLGYLTMLTGQEQHFDGVLSATHFWRGEAQYRAVMTGLDARVRDGYARLVRTLEQAYLLPDTYRAPRLAITTSVNDDRQCGRTRPLDVR